jgi:hypothetical protein
MKKILSIVAFGLISCTTMFQASAVKLKLKHNCDSDHVERTPRALVPYLDQYLTFNGSVIHFTPDKRNACDFDMEEIVRTTLGTVYYRITYQDNAVLVWDPKQELFIFISKDERINPLKTQIQWLTLLAWLCGRWDVSSIANVDIKFAIE